MRYALPIIVAAVAGCSPCEGVRHPEQAGSSFVETPTTQAIIAEEIQELHDDVRRLNTKDDLRALRSDLARLEQRLIQQQRDPWTIDCARCGTFSLSPPPMGSGVDVTTSTSIAQMDTRTTTNSISESGPTAHAVGTGK